MADLYSLLRPLLFQLDAETAHNTTFRCLRALQACRGTSLLPGAACSKPVEAMGLTFPNPIGLAAGMDKNGECVPAFEAMGFGFVEVGTVTPRPQPGNPRPRLFRLPEQEAIINRMGFNNAGAEALVDRLRSVPHRGVLGINIGKNKDTPLETADEDYRSALRTVYEVADYIAVNISSPNTVGLRELQGEDALNALLETICSERDRCALEQGRRVPLAVKVAPDMEEQALKEMARVLASHPIDGVIATNTTVARPGLEGTRWAEESGGLSGRPLADPSLDVLRILRQALPDPMILIGVGGILTGEQAVQKLTAGADLIQLYSGLIYRGPGLLKDIAQSLENIGQ